MSTSSLPKSADFIRQAVYKFGTLTIGQVFNMFPSEKPETINFYVMALYKKQLINILDGKYLVPSVLKEVDSYMADSIWVMLDKVNLLETDQLELSFKGENPVKASFISDNILYQVVPITSYTMSSIRLITERDNARNIDKDNVESDSYYVFLIKDKNLLNRMSEYNITTPHIVAVMEENEDDVKPQITYYKA